VDSFIEQMKQEGYPDSEGAFSLSGEKSHWKMAQYRLANRSDYPMHVLAAAVAGGASRFKLERDEQSTFFAFDGEHYFSEDFEALSDPALPRSARLAELEIALSAASGHSTVRFAAEGRNVRRELQVVVGEVTVHEIEISHEHKNTFLVETPIDDADLERFIEMARFAPLDLTVDGEKVNECLDFGAEGGLVRGVWEVKGAEPLSTGAYKPSETCFCSCRESTQGPSLLLCLVEPRWAGYEDVLLLSRGVVKASESKFFGFPMITGAVTTSHLQRDLSAQNVVQNQEYKDFLAWIQREVDRFLCAFSQNPPQTRGVFDRVFRLEIDTRYKNRPVPSEIMTYLANKRGLTVTRDEKQLDETVIEAKKSGSEVYLNRVDAALLFEVEKATASQEWEEARQWNQAHLYLRGRAGRPVERNQAIERWFRFIVDGKVAVEWAQETMLDISLRPADRYRAALLILPHESWEEYLSELDQINVSDSWKEPLLLFRKDMPQTKDPSWNLMRELFHGTVEGFLEAYHKATDMDPTRRAAWLELLAQTRAGNMEWKEQIKLTAVRSTSWVKTPGPVKRELYAELEAKKEAQKEAKRPPLQDPKFFSLPDTHALHLPVMVYQCWLLRQAGPAWQKLIVARTLLIESLRSLSSETELGEELPPRPF
jgi:hypothetical protein